MVNRIMKKFLSIFFAMTICFSITGQVFCFDRYFQGDDPMGDVVTKPIIKGLSIGAVLASLAHVLSKGKCPIAATFAIGYYSALASFAGLSVNGALKYSGSSGVPDLAGFITVPAALLLAIVGIVPVALLSKFSARRV